MENLQKKLWLWLAQVQTANMNAQAYNTANTNQPWRFQIEWWIAWWSQWVIGQQKLSPPTPYESNISSVAPLSESIQLNWFSTPASVSTPESTTNMSIADTFSWITKKKNTNIAQSTKQIDTIPPIWGVPTVPVSPTLAINQQQRLANIAKRQGIMGQVAPVAPIPSPTWLQWAELQAYNQLTPQEQKTFQALATQGIKAQTDYLQQSKANQEYLKSQEELNKQMEQNRDQAEDIQARQQLESTAKQVANLKQNIGYLGSQGQPWVSATKLDAVSNQVALAQKTYDDVVKIDQLNKANRQLGQESHAIQFTRQMTQLQDDLDSKVNKTIQWALNQFNAAELKGKLDTIPEIEAFQQQLYAQLDWDLSSIMDTNIEARKFLIDRYDRLAESQKEQMQATAKAESEYQKNANTLNKEMSNALGYFVNNNWEPLVDQKTGQQIVVPPETTTNYDASTGQMILMTKNRDGTVGVQIKQVGTGKPTSNWTKIGVNADGSDKYGFVDATKNTVTPYVSPTGEATGDLRYLADQFPNQAWAKNNNPAGITWNANFDKWLGTARLLQQAGIQYSKGTARPSNEWGNYVTFNTIEDGLRAQQILMTQTYGNSTVWQMLSSWVWTSEWPNYAKQVAGMAGITDLNQKVSSLSPEQVSALQMSKIQKESPWLYKLLTQSTWTPPTGWLAEDINVKVANIGNIAFGRTMSDTEWKRVESIIKQNPNASVNDIALAVRGLNIKNDEDKPLALEYVNIFDKMSDSVKPKTGLEMTISKYINAGDYKGLNDFVTKNVDRQVKADSDSPILTPEYNVGKQRTEKLLNLIEKNKDKLGIVSGNVSDFLQKFEWDKDYQQIKTILQMSQADMRKYFAGSAVTETEMKALADFIGGTTKMAPDNLVTMLQTLNEDRTNTYNAQREWFQIPNVNAVQAKKKLGWFSLSDIFNNLD